MLILCRLIVELIRVSSMRVRMILVMGMDLSRIEFVLIFLLLKESCFSRGRYSMYLVMLGMEFIRVCSLVLVRVIICNRWDEVFISCREDNWLFWCWVDNCVVEVVRVIKGSISRMMVIVEVSL